MDTNNKNNKVGKSDMKESDLIRKIKTILIKDYGYSSRQIGYQVAIGEDIQKRVDLAVFDENKNPIIIVEVKTGNFVLPLFEHQLKEILEESKANFGLLYNGIEIRAYKFDGKMLDPIKKIPNKKEMKKIQKVSKPDVIINLEHVVFDINDKFKSLTTAEVQIPILADIIRRDFYDYKPLLQILALKILDESDFQEKFLHKFPSGSIDNDIYELWNIGRRHLPNLFQTKSFPHIYKKQRFLEMLETVKTFTLKSDADVIGKLFFKYGLGKDWSNFPKELSQFMFDLLEIKKDKKILFPYARQGDIFDIIKLLEKKFDLKKQKLEDYLKNYLVGIEVNKTIYEILKINSELQDKPIKLINSDFLKLDSKFVNNFDYVFCMPPIGAELYDKEIKYEYGSLGRSLINYVIVKLQKSQKHLSKVAIIVPQSFLFTKNLVSLRLSLAHPCYLRGIIQLPSGVFTPQTGVSMALLILNFQKPNTKIETWNHVFLSEIPETNSREQKLDLKILKKVLENFKSFEKGESFKQTSLSFSLHQNRIIDSWSVSDKTPEMQKLRDIPNGVELGEIGEVFFGKPVQVEESGTKEQQIPYLRIGDMKNGLINDSISKTVTVKNKKKYLEVLIQQNDILLSCQATIGKVALARKKDIGILISPQLAIIRPKTKKVLPEFLLQALSSEMVQNQLKIKSRGTFIQRLNKDDLRNIIVPKPPLVQQKKLIINFQKSQKKIEQLEKELEKEKRSILKFRFGD